VRYWPILTRLCVTLGMLTIIRLGYFIPVPGVDMAQLPAAAGGMEGEGPGGLGLTGKD
jgi:preprotein translocase subunit SecY